MSENTKNLNHLRPLLWLFCMAMCSATHTELAELDTKLLPRLMLWEYQSRAKQDGEKNALVKQN